jgi:nucleoside-diphosphate-sugar epimerase
MSRGEVINLGRGEEISIGDLAKLVSRLAARDISVTFSPTRARPPASEVERLLADRRKAKRLLGWEPDIQLEDGLRRTIDWLAGSLDAYKPSLYNV